MSACLTTKVLPLELIIDFGDSGVIPEHQNGCRSSGASLSIESTFSLTLPLKSNFSPGSTCCGPVVKANSSPKGGSAIYAHGINRNGTDVLQPKRLRKRVGGVCGRVRRIDEYPRIICEVTQRDSASGQ